MSFFSFDNRNKQEKIILYFFLILQFLIPAICFYLFQENIFFYQENNSLFVFSGEFLREFTGKPGGLLEYAGIFMTQGYFSSLYGSFVLSVIFVLIVLVFIEINKLLSVEKSFSMVLIIIPSCLIMLSQKRYEHLMHYNLGFLLVLLWFLFSIHLKKRFKMLIPALFPFFFYVAGSFCFLYLGMYLVYCVIFEKGNLKYTGTVSLLAVAIFTFFIFKEVLFFLPGKYLLSYPLQNYFSSGIPVFMFFSSGCVILFPLIIKGLGRISNNILPVFQLITILIIFLATGVFLSTSDDPVLADNTRLEQSLYKQDWNEIIRDHESSPSTNIIGQFNYNLALSETGQLCDRLFAGRQDFGSGSLSLSHEDRLIDKEIYYYYAIGLVNEAHHLATESLVKNGYRPQTLKLLVKTEIINGNYKIAERFLKVLKRTLHYREWSERYEQMLSDHTLINSDPELREEIRMLPGNDFFIKPADSQNIESILKTNPENIAAFEYKMARLLLDKDLKSIAAEAGKMKEIGYTYFPRYIGEAIVEAKYLNRELIDTGGLSLRPKTELRFSQYLKDCQLNENLSRPVLEEKMKESWGDTFWFYYEFR